MFPNAWHPSDEIRGEKRIIESPMILLFLPTPFFQMVSPYNLTLFPYNTPLLSFSLILLL